ncbi:hypothetical protein MTR67_034505 [Solanum verrucosum]|uniref:Uncharacterized protein n=1 Tax=Solanum verrucosum TaxID=315347 RepID=A0AAF0ZKH2_SOLVR|nr:hypothetical protein MTR67_034505 [Solanum verrucosum]
MGGGFKMLNAIGESRGKFPKDAKFKALYNEEVNYMGNQIGGSHPNYLRPVRNKVGTNDDTMVGEFGTIGVVIEEMRKLKNINTSHLMISPIQKNKLHWWETELMIC